MEPLMTYSEQRFKGKRTFQLLADHIVVRGSEALSSTYEQTIRLESLRPEFDRLWSRGWYFSYGVRQTIGSLLAVSILRSGFGMAINTNLGALATVCAVSGLLLTFAARRKVEYTISGRGRVSPC